MRWCYSRAPLCVNWCRGLDPEQGLRKFDHRLLKALGTNVPKGGSWMPIKIPWFTRQLPPAMPKAPKTDLLNEPASYERWRLKN